MTIISYYLYLPQTLQNLGQWCWAHSENCIQTLGVWSLQLGILSTHSPNDRKIKVEYPKLETVTTSKTLLIITSELTKYNNTAKNERSQGDNIYYEMNSVTGYKAITRSDEKRVKDNIHDARP